MASFAARSILRLSTGSVRNSATTRLGSEARAARSPFRMTAGKPLPRRTLRCSAELSFCLESMLPFHSATASALMKSMLPVSRRNYCWLPDGLYLNGESGFPGFEDSSS